MAYARVRQQKSMLLESQVLKSTAFTRREERKELAFYLRKDIENLQRRLDELLLEDEEDECVDQLNDEAEILKLESDIHDLEEEMQATLDLVDLKQSELDHLQIEIEGHRSDIEIKRARIKDLMSKDCDDSPPGPRALVFVEGTAFMSIAAVVIVSNIVTLILEVLNHNMKDNVLLCLDQFYMLFYIVEIICKTLYWRDRYLLGTCSRVWWNWLDVIIVVTGCLDMYVMPGLAAMGIVSNGHTGTSFLGFMRILRLARLVRILKIVKIFLLSDFKWCESERFQMFITCMICTNSVTIGLESDFPEFALWVYLEQVILSCYCFELAVRLKRWGRAFFHRRDDWAWNLFDFMIVVGGIMEQWALPVYAYARSLLGVKSTIASGEMGQTLMILRMTRLCRILRLVRLVRQVPQLHVVATGMAKGMHGTGWVLLLAGTILYGSAILCLKLFGHNLLGGVPDDVASLFPSVRGSFFSMFNAMNGHYNLLSPLWNHYPIMKYFMMVFTVITSWGILSTMTAVMADNMIFATKTIAEDNERIKKMASQTKLLKLFRRADVDGDGTLSESEFKDHLLSNEKFKLQLERVTDLDEHDLEYLFDYLSRKPKEKRATPDGRELSKDEFRRRYGRDRGDELWLESHALEKRTTQDGEPLCQAEFEKRFGFERGKSLWGKAPMASTRNAVEPMISQHDFIEGLMCRTDHVTERSFIRLEKHMHDALDSIELLVDEILQINRDAPGMGHALVRQVSNESKLSRVSNGSKFSRNLERVRTRLSPVKVKETTDNILAV